MTLPTKPVEHHVRQIRRGVWSYDLVWLDGSRPPQELVEECYNRQHADRNGRRRAEQESRVAGWAPLTASQSQMRYQKKRLKHAVLMKRTLEEILNAASLKEARKLAAQVLSESIPDEAGADSGGGDTDDVFAQAA